MLPPRTIIQRGGISMTEIAAYQEYIRCKHNAFCKAVIRYTTIGKIIRLRQKWEREISLDYLTNEKFIQFAEPEPDEEHPLILQLRTLGGDEASTTFFSPLTVAKGSKPPLRASSNSR